MREFLRQRYPYVDVEKIKLTSEGEDWSELRKLVASDSDLPDREEVLMLIDYHRDNIVKRKELLQKLNQGMAYRYIVRNVLPKLRRAEITVVREVPEMEKNTFQPVSSVSGLFVSKQEEALPSDQPDKPEGESKESMAYEVVVSEAEGPVESKTVLAVKNNLLYDLALAPNLDMQNKSKATTAILYKKPLGLRFKPQELSYLVTYKDVDGKTYLNYIRNTIRFKCDWKRKLFSTSYTVASEMVVTDRKEGVLENIPNKEAFSLNQIFYDKVDEYWNPDFWGNYNIIEPTESLESAVNKLKKQQK